MALYTLPNLLTVFRILCIPLIAGLLFLESFVGDWAAFVLYSLACITDFIDGYVARALKQTSSIGRFLDPIADKLLVSTLLIALTALGRFNYWHVIPAMLIVNREIFISGLREFLADYKITVYVDTLGKWKTTFQMLALGFLITGSSTPPNWGILTCGIVLLWASALLTIWSGVRYLTKSFSKMG
jgi:cardiolipin synthase (CMP-forming)